MTFLFDIKAKQQNHANGQKTFLILTTHVIHIFLSSEIDSQYFLQKKKLII